MKKLFLLVLAVLMAPLLVAEDECKNIIALGFITQTHIKQTGDTTQDVLNWLRSDNFRSYTNSSSAGMGLNIPIEGIPFDFNANTDDSTYQQLKNSLDKGNSSYYNNTFANDIMTQVADPNVIAAWQACMLNKDQVSGGGLIGVVEDEMGNNVHLRIKWQPRMNVSSVKISDITIVGATYNPKVLKVDDVIGTEWKTILLVRKKNKDLSIVINLKDNLGSYSKSIPAIVIPRKPLKVLCLAGDLAAFQRIDELSKAVEKVLPKNIERRSSRELSILDDLAYAVGKLIEYKTAEGEASPKVSEMKEMINGLLRLMTSYGIKYY